MKISSNWLAVILFIFSFPSQAALFCSGSSGPDRDAQNEEKASLSATYEDAQALRNLDLTLLNNQSQTQHVRASFVVAQAENPLPNFPDTFRYSLRAKEPRINLFLPIRGISWNEFSASLLHGEVLIPLQCRQF